MRLITVEQILKAADEAGAPVTREQFNYYSRLGLLFSPDLKIKRRRKEGIISFYAEEAVGRLKTMSRLKETGDSLAEIKSALLEEDKKQVVMLHEKAGLPAGRQTGALKSALQPGTSAEAGLLEAVRRWGREGYYRGLIGIYYEVVDKLVVARTVRATELARMEGLEARVLSQVNAFWDKRKIKGAFEQERSDMAVRLGEMDQNIRRVVAERDELVGFWVDQVDDGRLLRGAEAL